MKWVGILFGVKFLFSILFGISWYLHLEFVKSEGKKNLNGFIKMFYSWKLTETQRGIGNIFFAYFCWPIVARIGRRCWIVGFRKLPKLADTSFPMLTWGRCWRREIFHSFLNHTTGSLRTLEAQPQPRHDSYAFERCNLDMLLWS